MDMVKSMISNANLLLSFWSEALKTSMYVLNNVPSKAVQRLILRLGKDESQVQIICMYEIIGLR